MAGGLREGRLRSLSGATVVYDLDCCLCVCVWVFGRERERVLCVLCVVMFMYYTVCYFTGIFDAVVRQISVLFMDSKDSVFKKGAHKQADMRAPAHSQPAIGWYLCTETYARFLYCTSFHRPP